MKHLITFVFMHKEGKIIIIILETNIVKATLKLMDMVKNPLEYELVSSKV